MKKWIFENGIEVYEKPLDFDLHGFAVYDGDRFLGFVSPSSIADMDNCIALLDAGRDPITDGWDDGCGNPCTLDGWDNGFVV